MSFQNSQNILFRISYSSLVSADSQGCLCDMAELGGRLSTMERLEVQWSQPDLDSFQASLDPGHLY